MKKALVLFRASMKTLVLAVSLLWGAQAVHAQSGDTASVPAKPAHASSSATGKTTSSQVYNSVKSLKNEMASLHEQFKSLIEEVSALQDRVTGIQSSLDQVNASRRIPDLEKAISDLNGKSVGNSNVAEEAKSQVLDLTRKIKTQEDILDQLRDQVDRLQREVIEEKSHTDEAPLPPASPPQAK